MIPGDNRLIDISIVSPSYPEPIPVAPSFPTAVMLAEEFINIIPLSQ